MTYEPKNFEHLLGIEGFSDELLKNHFTLYQGYATNTNKLLESLSNLVKEGKTGVEFAELKRRFGWEFNGMRMHEYYFENITKEAKQLNKNSNFFKKLVEDFGSFENWEKEFKAMGIMRGIGWVILFYDLKAKRLLNVWINEHDAGHLSGAVPLIVMDVFEHAYIADYRLKRADYIEAFFRVISWTVVSERFNEVF